MDRTIVSGFSSCVPRPDGRVRGHRSIACSMAINDRRVSPTTNNVILTMKFLVAALLAGAASAYVAPKAFTARPTTQLQESFGFDFAEDSYGNQPIELGGEESYKQWINGVSDNPFLNRQVSNVSVGRSESWCSRTPAHRSRCSSNNSTKPSLGCESWIFLGQQQTPAFFPNSKRTV